MRKRWIFRDEDPIAERRLREELDIGPITARVLTGRGFTDPAIVQQFIRPRLADLPHPRVMCGAEAAARRIADALEGGESIVVHGDYDADGITATALMVEFFAGLGYTVDAFLPNRMEQGYGFSADAVRELAGRGHRLIITVDCGANDHAAVQAARAAGLDVIVTDHHEISGDPAPAQVLINPHQSGCGLHEENLAGVGVAFFLAAAIRIELAARGNMRAADFDLKSLLDLVSLGTVADVVELVGVNRVLVHHGLIAMESDARPGLTALKKVAGVTGRVRASDIAFRLAPRLNAAGRLGDAGLGLRLLLTRDPAEARTLAAQLHEENSRRQGIEAQILDHAKSMLARIPRFERLRSIVLVHPEWHPGVVGIVASRMVDTYQRPTILICAGDEPARGSGRSLPSFNLFEGLVACEDLLEGYGGHAQAAGLQIKAGNVAAFARAFDQYARSKLTPDDLVPTQSIDAECELDQIGPDLVRELSLLAPFGSGNAEPVLAARDVKVLNKMIVGNDHLKLRVEWRDGAMAVMAYGRGDLLARIGSRVDLAFSAEFSYYGGVEHVQLRARDVVVSDE